ncbi:monocarboxylate transporter 13-like [Brevipalpus obovatus]|uniref:monocarboxylate transporter 13-like n=1 Tax=Brevipalpus obovatus TaxID=246614 RepID=UPI003D9E2C8B
MSPNSVENVTDRGYAWVIPFACCFINAILFGIYRSYGILYTAILDSYHVSRSEATWPFSLCMTVIHLSGPISGILNSHLAIRTIVFVGCLLSAIGLALCYFATCVTDVVIFIGIIQGFGIGITYVQNPAIINEYFVKYRATANGIALAGGTLGAFAISPLTQKSLEVIGLQKTFLALGTLVLFTLPASLMLRPKKEKELEQMKDEIKRIFSISPVYLTRYKQNDKDVCHSTNCFYIQDGSFARKQSIASETVRTALDGVSRKFVKIAQNMERRMTIQDTQLVNTIKKLSESANHSKARQQVDRIVYILQSPCFALIAITHLAYFWGVLTFIMVAIDHAVDKGISRTNAVHLITMFSAGDLISRLGSGLFLDNPIIPTKYLSMGAIISTGVLLKCVPLSSDYYYLMGISCGLGLISGMVVTMLNTLFCKYLGTENAPMAFGLSSFFCGFATLLRPMLVGYFRDRTNGSYDGLFDLLSVFGILAGALWLLEPFINREDEKLVDGPDSVKVISEAMTFKSSDKLKGNDPKV